MNRRTTRPDTVLPRSVGAAAVAWSVLLLVLFVGPPALSDLEAQSRSPVPPEQLERVMPDADRFSELDGDPPVIRAYRAGPSGEEDLLVGYVFLTSDWPPQVMGYDAPIDVLVGMDLEGTLTGISVARHRESLQRTRGDFLSTRGYQEQYAGKHITDPFRVRRDVDNISGATISVEAMALGIRNAARRVASTHLTAGAPSSDEADRAPLTVEEFAELNWLDLLNRGPVARLPVLDGGIVRLEIFLLHLWDEEVSELLLGPERYDEAREEAGERLEEREALFLGVDGSTIRFRPYMLFLAQDGDTLSVSNDDLILFPEPRTGMVADQLRTAGLWLVDGPFDPSRPFTVLFGGELGMDVFTVEVPGRPAPAVVAEASPADAEAVVELDEGPEGEPDEPDEPEGGSATEDDEPEPRPEEAATVEEPLEGASEAEAPEEELEGGAGADARSAAPPPGLPDFDLDAGALYEIEEESQLARTLARTSWARVGGLLALLILASVAFATKATPLRWVTLTATFLYLGFMHGGFLSVSHITSGIAVGPGVYLNDLSLLAIVLFTLVTTLLWGRIFCGYLCPFGALQDLLDRIVPDRFRRRMPPWIHDRALWVKYLVLLIVLAPAVAGIHVSLYQYFEPFGTVFFLSPSILLWAIALGFVLASAVVPRFYCRYACPLGAALGVVSRVSPFRIRRVEQCTHCKVCEQSCPTGAIRGAVVDFPECVRCSVCEVNLIERAGSCRHEMETIRPRLVQLQQRAGS